MIPADIEACTRARTHKRTRARAHARARTHARLPACQHACAPAHARTPAHTRTPARPHARTPARPHARTPARPHARTPARPHARLHMPNHRPASSHLASWQSDPSGSQLLFFICIPTWSRTYENQGQSLSLQAAICGGNRAIPSITKHGPPEGNTPISGWDGRTSFSGLLCNA